MRILLALATAAGALAQSGLDRPHLGEMVDQRGVLRPVLGVAGSFVLENPRAKGVLSSACSRVFCLAKTDSAILSGDAMAAAPPGPARIGLDGASAWIYFPQTRQFARWQAGEVSFIHVGVEGEVLSIQAGLKLAVRRDSAVWIVSADGTVLDSLPSEATEVLLIDGGLVYATEDSLVLRRSDRGEIRFAASGVTALLAMGDGYVEARAGRVAFALRTDIGSEHLFLLPQPLGKMLR